VRCSGEFGLRRTAISRYSLQQELLQHERLQRTAHCRTVAMNVPARVIAYVNIAHFIDHYAMFSGAARHHRGLRLRVRYADAVRDRRLRLDLSSERHRDDRVRSRHKLHQCLEGLKC
jgi:hypothetical protein